MEPKISTLSSVRLRELKCGVSFQFAFFSSQAGSLSHVFTARSLVVALYVSILFQAGFFCENLRKRIDRLRGTGAKLIWASSTPIPNGGNLAPNRQFGSIQQYNAISKRVMDEKAITINDLNAAVTPQIDRLQKPNDVHFTDEGSEILAEHVAKAVSFALQLKSP